MNNLNPDPSSQIEKLAAVQHEIWAHWMSYLFSVCKRRPDGSYIIPAEFVQQWQRQIDTPYADLSEKEKNSDREQAAKVSVVVKSSRRK